MREPSAGEVLVEVARCGVCRTDLHVADGELTGRSCRWCWDTRWSAAWSAAGIGVERFREGDRVGVPWLGATCGRCPHWPGGAENLCDAPEFTGYTRDGGLREPYAGRCRLRLCPAATPTTTRTPRPLLCAGLIVYRALRFADDAKTLRIYGFGRRGAPDRPAGDLAGQAGVCLHQAGRCRRPGLRPRARLRLGRRLDAAAAGTARRGGAVRAGRQPGAGGATRHPQGRHGRLRQAST